MVEPGSTIPGEGTADDTQPTAPVASPASSGRGWSSYSNNKKLAIGAGVGVLIGGGIYLWARHKRTAAANAAATANANAITGANNTAPQFVLPVSNQDAVQGANDAALDTALGSVSSQLNQIGNDVNNLQPTVTTNNITTTTPTSDGGSGSLFQPAASGGANTIVTAAGQTVTAAQAGQIVNGSPLTATEALYLNGLAQSGADPFPTIASLAASHG